MSHDCAVHVLASPLTPRTVEAATRVTQINGFSSVISGLLVGLILYRVRYTKPFIVFGATMYLLAYGLLYRYRGGHTRSELAGLIGGEVVLGIGSE